MSIAPIEGSNIVITGVTRGLGRAMVAEFIRLGHRVLGCARTEDMIEDLRRIYPTSDFQTVDVAVDTQVQAWANRLLREYGAPDLVVNNAAVLNSKANLWEVGDQDFADTIDINIKGVVNVIRHFIPSMINCQRGVLVNFTSRWGKTFEPQMAPYCATKWAVVALTRVLAEELRPKGIAAVGLNPGIVNTAMLQTYMGITDTSVTSSYKAPSEWARIAIPFILKLGLSDSGTLYDVPIDLTEGL